MIMVSAIFFRKWRSDWHFLLILLTDFFFQNPLHFDRQ